MGLIFQTQFFLCIVFLFENYSTYKKNKYFLKSPLMLNALNIIEVHSQQCVRFFLGIKNL